MEDTWPILFTTDPHNKLYLISRDEWTGQKALTVFDGSGSETSRAILEGQTDLISSESGDIYSLDRSEGSFLITRWAHNLQPVMRYHVPVDPDFSYWPRYAVNARGDLVFAVPLQDTLYQDQISPYAVLVYSPDGKLRYGRHYALTTPRLSNLTMDPDGNAVLLTYSDIVYLDHSGENSWNQTVPEGYGINGTLDKWGNVYLGMEKYPDYFCIPKLNNRGKLCWEYVHPYLPGERPWSMIDQLVLLPDDFGRLLVKRRSDRIYGTDFVFNAYLMLLGRNGELLWQKDLDQLCGEGMLVNRLFTDREGNYYLSGANLDLPKPQIIAASIDPAGNLRWLSGYTPEESYHWRPDILTAMDNQGGMYLAYAAGGYLWNTVHLMKIVQTGEHDVSTTVSSLSLGPNIPNPFNSTTAIRYRLPAAGPVAISVYDRQGRRVRTENLGVRPAGENTWYFRGDDIASGVYYYQIKTGRETKTGKMVLVK